MKYLIRLILIVLIFFPCCRSGNQDKEKPDGSANLSENENKGIKEILAFYGGKCEYGIIKKINIGAKNETDFWIKFSKSRVIDSLYRIAKLSCANIAYLFFKNLQKEKESYNHILSKITFENGEEIDLSFTMTQLEIVKNKIQVVNKIVDLIKNKSISDLQTHLIIDTSLFNYDKNKLLKSVENVENEYGSITQFVPFGFIFYNADNGKDLLHISGCIKREKVKSTLFSVDLDPYSSNDDIYLLNYKF